MHGFFHWQMNLVTSILLIFVQWGLTPRDYCLPLLRNLKAGEGWVHRPSCLYTGESYQHSTFHYSQKICQDYRVWIFHMAFHSRLSCERFETCCTSNNWLGLRIIIYNVARAQDTNWLDIIIYNVGRCIRGSQRVTFWIVHPGRWHLSYTRFAAVNLQCHLVTEWMDEWRQTRGRSRGGYLPGFGDDIHSTEIRGSFQHCSRNVSRFKSFYMQKKATKGYWNQSFWT